MWFGWTWRFFVDMANSGDTSYFHEFKEFCGSGKSGETGESCECECGDSRADGDSDD